MIIKYNTEFQSLPNVTTVATCLLMSLLEEYFEQFPNGFKKNLFASSKGNKTIREILNMGEAQLKLATQNIASSYKNLEAFNDETNFDGKYYMIVTFKRETYWKRNDALFEEERY